MRMGSAMTPGLVACLVLSCTGPDSPGEADGPSSGLQTTTVTPSRPHSAPPTTPSGSPGVLPGRAFGPTEGARPRAGPRRGHAAGPAIHAGPGPAGGGIPAARRTPTRDRVERDPPHSSRPGGTRDRARGQRRPAGGQIPGRADRAPGAAAAVADHRAASGGRAARLLRGSAAPHRRALDLPRRHPPGRDAHGPDPGDERRGRAGPDAVPALDMGAVRRGRRHQRPARRDPRRGPPPASQRGARGHGARVVPLQPVGPVRARHHRMPGPCSGRRTPTAATGTGGCCTATFVASTSYQRATQACVRFCWSAADASRRSTISPAPPKIMEPPASRQRYVGVSAFAHKSGLHMDPECRARSLQQP
jgi:hypothetical protein